jgi:MoxR-like ATPase
LLDRTGLEDPDRVRGALAAHGYLAGEGLSTVVFLALSLSRPLFLEGEAGVGKTELAKVLSELTGGELVRLQCYEGIDVSQAVYEWDYSRQLLHLRAAEVRGGRDPERGRHREGATEPQERSDGRDLAAREPQLGSGSELEDELYSERFLVRRPLLRAITAAGTTAATPPVLLIDEIDRADDEFEALLLEVLSDYSVTVPELGTFRAAVAPVVVITSNRTRDVHDALKRRCLYHWVDHPDFELEVQIVELRAPEVPTALARQVAAAAHELRHAGLYKPPGVAETIDWAQALATIGCATLDEASIEATLGAVVKYREDAERIMDAGVGELVRAAVGRER